MNKTHNFYWLKNNIRPVYCLQIRLSSLNRLPDKLGAFEIGAIPETHRYVIHLCRYRKYEPRNPHYGT